MEYAGRKETNDCAWENPLYTTKLRLVLLVNGFSFWALSQELMTRVTRQWHRNVSSKRWWDKKQLLSDYPHIVSLGPVESQHRDFPKDLSNWVLHTPHLTHHHQTTVTASKQPSVESVMTNVREGTETMVTWWQHPGCDQCVNTWGESSVVWVIIWGWWRAIKKTKANLKRLRLWSCQQLTQFSLSFMASFT